MQELKEKFISESRPEDHNKWRTDQDIRDAVKLWIDDQEAAVTKYGHMKEWETECVTDMSGLFDGCETFSEDVSKWKTSNVTRMDRMFFNAKAFRCDIGSWDTS